MKDIKAKEITTKSVNELLDLMNQTVKEIIKLKMDLKVGKDKNSGLLVAKKRYLAQIKTIITEKELLESQKLINTK
jgi:ribosomal protein L29